jgi:hypothetical protein
VDATAKGKQSCEVREIRQLREVEVMIIPELE